jgi:hypothetical protein
MASGVTEKDDCIDFQGAGKGDPLNGVRPLRLIRRDFR